MKHKAESIILRNVTVSQSTDIRYVYLGKLLTLSVDKSEFAIQI